MYITVPDNLSAFYNPPTLAGSDLTHFLQPLPHSQAQKGFQYSYILMIRTELTPDSKPVSKILKFHFMLHTMT